MDRLKKKTFAMIMICFLLYDCIFFELMYVNDDGDQAFYSIISHRFYPVALSQLVDPVENKCDHLGGCQQAEQYILPVCYCDLACIEYNDCCYDAPLTDTVTSVSSLDDKKEYTFCVKGIFDRKYFGVWMVSKCPLSYTMSGTSDRCNMEENKHPVSADDGTVYRNVHCAFCHNVTKVTSWQFEFLYQGECTAEKMKLLNTTINNKMKYVIENKCTYRFIPSLYSKIRSCFHFKTNNEFDNALCTKFQNPVIGGNKIYKNLYCTNKTTNCIESQLKASDSKDRRGYEGLLLTGIFNFSPAVDWFGSKLCHDSRYKYDVKMGTCVPTDCIEKTCDSELFRNYKWIKTITFITSGIIDRDFIIRFVTFVFLSLPIDTYDITTGNVAVDNKCGTNMADGTQPCCKTSTYIDFKARLPITEESAMKIEAEITKMTWEYQEIQNQTIITTVEASEKRNITDTCYSKGIQQKYFIGMININKVQPVFSNFITEKQPGLVPYHIKAAVRVSNAIPKQNMGDISKIQSAHFEFHYKKKNETITSNEDPVIKRWSVATIMTYITIGCSCCCLLFTLAVYGYLGLFKSSQGVISKHMMVTMLAAQLLFIVGVGANYIKLICTIIGIVSHYLWLSSFTWISLFLFSILKMMRQLSSCPGALVNDQNLSKYVYCFGYMGPLLIVLPCALLEFLTEIYIGYSGRICFLSGFLANFFSFTLPVILSLLFNVIALIVSSISLAKYNSTAKRIQSVRQARSFIPIYIRLTILCACPWLLGIIAAIVQIDVLNYIFILLSGSHGTFVSISFLCAGNVRKKCICRRNNNCQSRNTHDIELRAAIKTQK